MEITRQKRLSTKQKNRIMQMWNREYPKKIAYSDISQFENFLKGLTNKEHFFLTDTSGKIFGWLAVFTRHKERWFSIIVDSKLQGRGYGIKLIDKAKEIESKLCGWVIDHNKDKKQNGEVYFSPLKFYLKTGFTVCKNERLESEKLSCVKIEWTK